MDGCCGAGLMGAGGAGQMGAGGDGQMGAGDGKGTHLTAVVLKEAEERVEMYG